jgi:hypothetical protein
VSTHSIVVAVITGLLVVVTAYSLFLAFRGERDRKADDRLHEAVAPESRHGRQAA